MGKNLKLLACVALGGLVAGLGIWIVEQRDDSSPLITAPRAPPLERARPPLTLHTIDLLAAHPDDPHKPKHLLGVADADLGNVTEDQLIAVLQDGPELIADHPDAGRYLFQIARLAFSFGEGEYGLELLLAAADEGSAIASGYLGEMAEEMGTAKAYLQQASNGGYAPARPRLAALEQQIAEAEAERLQAAQERVRQQTGSYKREDIITALYNNDLETLRKNKGETLMYLNALVGSLHEPAAYYKVGDPNYQLDLDRSLDPVLAGALMTDASAMQQLAQPALSGLWQGLVSMAQERKSQMGRGEMNPYKEMAALNQGFLSGGVGSLVLLKAHAKQDSQRLILSWASDRAFFHKVYSGIQNFVYNYQ